MMVTSTPCFYIGSRVSTWIWLDRVLSILTLSIGYEKTSWDSIFHGSYNYGEALNHIFKSAIISHPWVWSLDSLLAFASFNQTLESHILNICVHMELKLINFHAGGVKNIPLYWDQQQQWPGIFLKQRGAQVVYLHILRLVQQQHLLIRYPGLVKGFDHLLMKIDLQCWYHVEATAVVNAVLQRKISLKKVLIQFSPVLSFSLESKLFFKQPTNWRPRVARDLVISVSSETKEQTCGPIGRVPQLPVQVLCNFYLIGHLFC